jgi:hypothetical protein
VLFLVAPLTSSVRVVLAVSAGGRGTAGANNRRKDHSMHLLFYARFGQLRDMGE